MLEVTSKNGKISNIKVEGEFSEILAQYTTLGFYIYREVANDEERKFMNKNWDTHLNPTKYGSCLKDISEGLENELEILVAETMKALEKVNIYDKESEILLKTMRKELISKMNELPENFKNSKTSFELNKLKNKIDDVLKEKDSNVLHDLFKNILEDK